MYSSPFERGSGGPAMRFYFCFCRERQPTHYSSTVLHTDFDNVDATSWNFILGFASCPHPSPLPKGEGARKFPSQIEGSLLRYPIWRWLPNSDRIPRAFRLCIIRTSEGFLPHC